MRVVTFLFVCVFALPLGCSKKPSSAAQTAESSAKPGSYEDWCEEHHVPESLCTQCNRDLIPAFKASGDWCHEHKLPESQCKKCKPNLRIVRAPKP